MAFPVKIGNQYIGITIQSLRSRYRGHISEALTSKGNSKFHRAIRKYGPANFEIFLLRDDAINYKVLSEQEINEIAARKTISLGYNTGIGGDVGTAKTIKIDDKVFPSWSIAASYFQIDPRNFAQRITKLGWTPEEAAGLVSREKFQRKEIKVGSKNFSNFKEAAKFYKIDYKTAFARKQRGWNVEQIFDILPPPDKRQRVKKFALFGRHFESQAEFARFLKVSPSYVTKLRKLGLSYKEIYQKCSS